MYPVFDELISFLDKVMFILVECAFLPIAGQRMTHCNFYAGC